MCKWTTDEGIRLCLSFWGGGGVTSKMFNLHDEGIEREKTEDRGKTAEKKVQVPVALCSATC